jgi:hypothetical protein
VLPRIDTDFLAEPRWGATSLAAVGGVWSVVVALAVAIARAGAAQWPRLASIARNHGRRRQRLGAAGAERRKPGRLRRRGRGLAGLRGGARLGAGDRGGPLVSLAVATNVLAALTGSASGG